MFSPVPAARRLVLSLVRRQGVSIAAVAFAGCMVGPAYAPPKAPVAKAWTAESGGAAHAGARIAPAWWTSFGDPALGRLVALARQENLSLQAAALRVVQARARRAIAVGNLFPQQQEVTGSYTRSRRSANLAGAGSVAGSTEGSGAGAASGAGRSTDSWSTGLDAAWELDLWGKYRRSIEAADAELLAARASHDDVLVSLLAEVATTYVRVRSLEERLAVAADNVEAQRDSLSIARVRFEAGGTSELDVEQAKALLHDTEARIPDLQIQRRQAVNSLSVLLGRPPATLDDLLGPPGRVPKVPPTVAVGIPADLLRRRPDVRRAEHAAAAQSARIGVATAELYPSFQLTGSIGLSADEAAQLIEGRSFEALGGPAFRWPVLNYGRLVNNVRLQDATFQELATQYRNTVLVAQREVEDALVGYLRGSEQVESLSQSVAAANRAVEISLVQYREGATDYTSILNAQQAKLREDDLLVSTRAAVALSVVGLYRALGGGWER